MNNYRMEQKHGPINYLDCTKPDRGLFLWGYGEGDAMNTIFADDLKEQRDELLATLKQALRHAREAMPAHERGQFDDGIAGPEWMFNVRNTIKKVEATL